MLISSFLYWIVIMSETVLFQEICTKTVRIKVYHVCNWQMVQEKIRKVPNKDFLCLLIYLSLTWALSKEGVGVRGLHTAVQGCLEKKPTHTALGHWVWLGGYQVCLLGTLPTSFFSNCPLCFLACPLKGQVSLSSDTSLKHLLSSQ